MTSNANVFRHQRVLFLTFAQGQNVGSAGPRSSPLPVLRSGEIHPIGTAAHINANDVPGTRIVRATEGTNKEEVGGTSSYVDVEPDTTRHSPCHHARLPDHLLLEWPKRDSDPAQDELFPVHPNSSHYTRT